MPISATSANSINRTIPATTIGENAGMMCCAAASWASGESWRGAERMLGTLAAATAALAACTMLPESKFVIDIASHPAIPRVQRDLGQKFQERLRCLFNLFAHGTARSLPHKQQGPRPPSHRLKIQPARARAGLML